MAEGKGIQRGDHGGVEIPGWARDGLGEADGMH